MDKLAQFLKPISMPLCMLCGAIFCRPISALDALAGHHITPALIFLMLFVTFCRVRVQDLKFQRMHLWLILIQMSLMMVAYLVCLPFSEIVAQGAMICVLAPIAMAAVVIGGMLGANIASMAAFSLVSNMLTAIVAPIVLSMLGNGECTFLQILYKVVPMLVLPFLAAQLFRAVIPSFTRWVSRHSIMSFYMWLLSMFFIIGRTTLFIINHHNEVSLATEIALLLVALVACLLQFAIGRMVGARAGDAIGGGQSLGQKNTILAVWMAQTFLFPISSIAPTAYIVWQNIVNSYQIYRHDKSKVKPNQKQ